MSEQPALEQPSEVSPATVSQSVPTACFSERNKDIQNVIALCSLAMIGCFWLPWIRILGGNLSGYQLQQLPSDEAKLVWLVPFTAFFTLLTAIGKKGVLFTSQLAGAIPFLALIYFRLKLGDRFFLALQVGTYIILVLGAMLFVLPRFLKKPEPKT